MVNFKAGDFNFFNRCQARISLFLGYALPKPPISSVLSDPLANRFGLQTHER